jgi:hypothetical protein
VYPIRPSEGDKGGHQRGAQRAARVEGAIAAALRNQSSGVRRSLPVPFSLSRLPGGASHKSQVKFAKFFVLKCYGARITDFWS